jgi:hypothetical protein
MDNRLAWTCVPALLVCVAGVARSETATVRVLASKDTSIYSESLNSNAKGGNLYTGRNNMGQRSPGPDRVRPGVAGARRCDRAKRRADALSGGIVRIR